MTTVLIVAVVAGTIAGVLAGWHLAASRNKAAEGRVETELRQQIAARDGEIAALRPREALLVAEKSEAVTARALAEQRVAEFRQLAAEREKQVEESRSSRSVESNALAKSQADLEAARHLLADRQSLYEKQLQDARATQEKAITDLREAFKALSADALKANAPEFLRLAQQTFGTIQESAKGDLQTRQEAISGLLKPLEQQLKTYQERLQQSETTQSQAIGDVKKQLETLGLRSESLANETERFRMVLRSNQARGRWGEETLRRVVEAAGMSAHCDFVEQVQEEDKKPDMIVQLPGDHVIIVDAKVPDLEFIDALDTADLGNRTRLLAVHAAKLKDTIRALAKRDYPAQFRNALDYVVLFLPAESLFSAALEGDRDLIVWAAQNRILLTTPASLIALLRSVSVSWQQFAQTENARAITDAAQDLYRRVATFTEHFGRIRDGLAAASDAYNRAVGSYESRVRPGGERLLGLGFDAGGKDLADVRALDTTLRNLTDDDETKG